MTTIDYFIWAFLLGYPVFSYFTFKGEIKAVVVGKKSLSTSYWQTIFTLWPPALLVLFSNPFLYPIFGKSNVTDIVLAICITLIFIGVMVSVNGLKKQQRASLDVLEKMKPVAWLMPKSKNQLMLYIFGICTTAAIAEEIIYRGYVLSFLSQYMHEYWALLASSLLFGLPHIYQKVQGVFRTALVGLILGISVVLMQSLWLAIACHFIIDAYSGYLYYCAYKNKKSA